ncbi:MAG TPA: hypothetical protein VL551_20520 [Actinospica sp.]|jgi:hypothetical protein|nr:hypothetical protein [Actinospica sp.]
MTMEYLRGEMLLLLDWVQREAPHCSATEQIVAMLRREAESLPVDDLSWVLARTLPAAEAWCFDALAGDDAAAFRRCCRLAAAVYDFGICSGLMACRDAEAPPGAATIWRRGTEP